MQLGKGLYGIYGVKDQGFDFRGCKKHYIEICSKRKSHISKKHKYTTYTTLEDSVVSVSKEKITQKYKG